MTATQRLLMWATVVLVLITGADEVHGYWIINPAATCQSPHGDTYLQERACTLAITLTEFEGRSDANFFIDRGEAEETNCDLSDAASDYKYAGALAPTSERAQQLAAGAGDMQGEYCSRGENGDRAMAVVLSGAITILPYFSAGFALVCGFFWLVSRRGLAAVLLSLSTVSWIVVLFLGLCGSLGYSWRPAFRKLHPRMARAGKSFRYELCCARLVHPDRKLADFLRNPCLA
jgi:hypothetical protein